MTTMHYLLLGVTLACFVGEGLSVTDHEFQEFSKLVTEKFKDLSSMVNRQAQDIMLLKRENKHLKELVQNFTIEERVELLEIQVVEIQNDVSDIETDVDFLFEEQVIQDERLLNLEERMLNEETETDQIEEDIEGLQDTTLALEFQLTVLEGNVNDSISELEFRVEALEGTSADHETRITAAEGNIEGLEANFDDHETRLTAAEENIQGLQVTDTNHDARIRALEENETTAFSAALTVYDTIAAQAAVEFNQILLNQGNGYNSATGVFTVPSGGDGTYYLSTYLLVQGGEHGRFDMRLNDDVICTAVGEHNNNPGDSSQATCSAVVSVMEGDEVKVVNDGSTDDTPLYTFEDNNLRHGFNGFRI